MAKKERPCFNIITKASQNDFPLCCGIDVLTNFQFRDSAMIDGYNYDVYPWSSHPTEPISREAAIKHLSDEFQKLVLATTIPDQKDAIRALKAVGFKKVTTTPSNEGRYSITLWMWRRPRRKNARTI